MRHPASRDCERMPPSPMPKKPTVRHPHVLNWNDAPLVEQRESQHWGGREARLNPSMPPEDGHVGVVRVVLPPGRTYAPFHWHVHEDEIFIVLSGAGLLRYGDQVVDLRAGDCIACPRNSGQGHQIANVSSEDLVYLAIGENRPDEVCVYPDSGKVLVRALRRIGTLQDAKYFDGEPIPPKILAAKASKSRRKRH